MRICICWNDCLWWFDGIQLFYWSCALKLHFRLSVIIKHNRQRIGPNISRLLNLFLRWVVINELPVPVRRFTVEKRHRSRVLFATLKHNLLMRIRSQSPYQRLSLFWDKRRKWLRDDGVDLRMLVLWLRLLESKLRRLSRWLLPNGCKLQIITVNIIQRVNNRIAMGWSPVMFVVVSWMLVVGCLIIEMWRSLRAFIRHDWMVVIIGLAMSMVILVVCGYGVVIWIPLSDDWVDDCLVVRFLLRSLGSDGIGLILLVDGFVGDSLGFYWCLVGDCFVTLLLHGDLFEELILPLIVLSSNLVNRLLAQQMLTISLINFIPIVALRHINTPLRNHMLRNHLFQSIEQPQIPFFLTLDTHRYVVNQVDYAVRWWLLGRWWKLMVVRRDDTWVQVMDWMGFFVLLRVLVMLKAQSDAWWMVSAA